MAFRVEISAEAELEAEAILEWLLAQHSGDAGMQWFLRLEDSIASLATFPERCPLAPENARFSFEVRQLSTVKPCMCSISATAAASPCAILTRADLAFYALAARARSYAAVASSRRSVRSQIAAYV